MKNFIERAVHYVHLTAYLDRTSFIATAAAGPSGLCSPRTLINKIIPHTAHKLFCFRNKTARTTWTT